MTVAGNRVRKTGMTAPSPNDAPLDHPLRAALRFHQRLRRKFAEVGVAYAAYLVLRRAFVPRLFEFRSAILLALELHNLPPVPDGEGEIREATEADLQHFIDFGDKADFVLPRLKKGYRAWVIERDGAWLACDWLSPEAKTASSWLLIDGLPGDLWFDGIKVLAPYRGMGLALRLRRHIALLCARAGKMRLLGAVDDLNRNSFRALNKIGFKPIGRIAYVSLLGFSVIRYGKNWTAGIWSPDAPLRLGVDRMARRH